MFLCALLQFTHKQNKKNKEAPSHSNLLPQHRQCEGMSNLLPMLVSRTGQCEKVPIFPPSDTCTVYSTRCSFQRPAVKVEKQLNDPLKRHPEEFPHIQNSWEVQIRLQWGAFDFINLIKYAKLYSKGIQLYLPVSCLDG